MTQVDPAILTHRAASLFRTGPLPDAIAAYEALLAARPDLPNSWFNLALLQRRARDYAASLASCQRAIDLGIVEPEEVHLQRGVIFSDDLADSRSARSELNAALALNPEYVPALLNLGNLHEDLGEHFAAEAAYRRVLAREANPVALARLARLVRANGEDDPLLVRVREAIIAPEATHEDRASLGFALGASLDRIGAYDRAFAAYAQANRLARRSAVGEGFRYDRAVQEALVDRLIAAFPHPVESAPGDARESPLFIVGMFRSGSTLVEQILARHDAIGAGGEMTALPTLIAERLQPYPECIQSISRATLTTIRRDYLREAALRNPGGLWTTDKRPENFLYVGLIKALFPNARIVHTVRAALDNCLSVYFLHLDPAMSYASDLADIGHYYVQQQRLMAHWRRLYPNDIHTLDYDRLVAEPGAIVARLLDFCALDRQHDLLAIAKSEHGIRTASAWQVRQPLYRHASGRWRHYEPHLGALRVALGGSGAQI